MLNTAEVSWCGCRWVLPLDGATPCILSQLEFWPETVQYIGAVHRYLYSMGGRLEYLTGNAVRVWPGLKAKIGCTIAPEKTT